MMKKDWYESYTDGGARGNPGPAGIGGVLYDSAGDITFEFGEYIGETTNNQAEYRAIEKMVNRARELGVIRLRCHMDSELAVRQLNGEYKVKHPDLLPLHRSICTIAESFEHIEFVHVRRENNAYADRLVNRAIDESRAGLSDI